MDAAETGEAVLAGELKPFLGLGGNFVRAIPDTVIMEGLAQHSAYGADIHETQSQSRHTRQDQLHPALSWAHRNR